jgi:hypothetical protein
MINDNKNVLETGGVEGFSKYLKVTELIISNG